MPVAVSQPKKAQKILMPPNLSFSRATTALRSAVGTELSVVMRFSWGGGSRQAYVVMAGGS